MNRDIALRIDGMLWNIKYGLTSLIEGSLDAVPIEVARQIAYAANRSRREAIEVSYILYDLYPDIVPGELLPPEE